MCGGARSAQQLSSLLATARANEVRAQRARAAARSTRAAATSVSGAHVGQYVDAMSRRARFGVSQVGCTRVGLLPAYESIDAPYMRVSCERPTAVLVE